MTVVAGGFFERIQILVNGQPEVDSGGLFRVSVSGDEQFTPVNAFSANHLISGGVRGNGQYRATFSDYLRYNQLPFDWRSIDYDTQVVNLMLLAPNANYGTNNVFGNNSNYLLLSNCYLSAQSPLDAPGVGQPASEDLVLVVTNWQWISRNTTVSSLGL